MPSFKEFLEEKNSDQYLKDRLKEFIQMISSKEMEIERCQSQLEMAVDRE
jgi:hypothetical protein